MTNRRAFVALACTSFVPISLAAPVLTHDDALPPLPSDLAGAAGEPDFFSMQLASGVLGTADPGEAKRKFAQEIMASAPTNCRSIDVAYYFRDLGLGKTIFKEEGRPYARGWPRVYNPVIIELFTSTGLNPLSPSFDGDATPWCAAFVNYCIARSRAPSGKIGPADLKRGTQSASSGSFRCFGKKVPDGANPKEGDIAVWAVDGTIDGCKPGNGHVGFFVANNPDKAKPYLIMGGNQSGDLLKSVPTRNDGMFLKAMPTTYVATTSPLKYKRFFGFRTADYL